MAASDDTDGRIVDHAFIAKGQVQFDQVAGADRLAARDAVDDGLVDRDADDVREAFVAQHHRLHVVFFNLLGGIGGQLLGRDAGLNFAGQIFAGS